MAPDAPISGACELRRRHAVHEGAGDGAQQIEDQVAEMAERVLDIVAEHPQEQHVAAEVEDVAVQEGVGDVGQLSGTIVNSGGRSAMS